MLRGVQCADRTSVKDKPIDKREGRRGRWRERGLREGGEENESLGWGEGADDPLFF